MDRRDVQNSVTDQAYVTNAISINPDGMTMVTGSNGKIIQIWHLDSLTKNNGSWDEMVKLWHRYSIG